MKRNKGFNVRVRKALLSAGNPRIIGNVIIGDLIRMSGKEFLWSDRSGAQIDTIVIHYTSAINVLPDDPYNLETNLRIFCDYGVSPHYVIDRAGMIYRLVPEEKKAWHCGGSIMPEPDNRRGVNDFSIGIELLATPASGFTDAQYKSLANLCRDMEKRHCRGFIYVGHDQIAGERAIKEGLRHDLKSDPGKNFNWPRFQTLLKN